MPNQQATFRDQGTHIEVICYVDGLRRKFWVTKSKLQPGKDGRLYGHNGDLTLAVDLNKTPTHYTVLQRKAAKGLLLPPRLNEDGTPGRPKRESPSEEEKQRRADKREQQRQQRIREHVGAALFLCGVTAERWSEVESDIGLPSCGDKSRHDWLDQLDENLNIGDKLDALALILGCQKRKTGNGGR